MKDNKERSKVSKSRKLTEKEKKELLVNSIKRIRPFLKALEDWQKKPFSNDAIRACA